MFPHVTAVINAKGGVQKTTIVAALAHRAAAEGKRVLVIDLDPQGNCAHALGYAEDGLPGVDASDGGQALAHSLLNAEPLTPREIRPGMFVCDGGPELSQALRAVASWEPARKFSVGDQLIEPIADDFDLILIDTPPTNLDVQAMTLGVCAAVVIPCEVPDDTAEEGTIGALSMVQVASKRGNPACKVAAVVLSATRISHDSFLDRRRVRTEIRDATARLHEFDPDVTVLTSFIRQHDDANLLRRYGRSTAELLSTSDIDLRRRQRRNLKRLGGTITAVLDELYPRIAMRTGPDQPLACELPPRPPVSSSDTPEDTVDLTQVVQPASVDVTVVVQPDGVSAASPSATTTNETTT